MLNWGFVFSFYLTSYKVIDKEKCDNFEVISVSLPTIPKYKEKDVLISKEDWIHSYQEEAWGISLSGCQ